MDGRVSCTGRRGYQAISTGQAGGQVTSSDHWCGAADRHCRGQQLTSAATSRRPGSPDHHRLHPSLSRWYRQAGPLKHRREEQPIGSVTQIKPPICKPRNRNRHRAYSRNATMSRYIKWWNDVSTFCHNTMDFALITLLYHYVHIQLTFQWQDIDGMHSSFKTLLTHIFVNRLCFFHPHLCQR